ncbi:integrase core domain-containing protein [Blastopirellula sp. JC732]|uniref:Integrase core domain-containing protein n=2 Tax=Blastopirellula sediminis TaxID=2894196 RepID=A0A9X1SEZ2_9BACT|nr:integrase core domain-containing protein [Blastopirellula sediminis]MCC9608106.1 integrase core domain-containing protein [Blastopirellula sediminis]MCC9627101.1 integrase core domain-containing protein [Blastopirellula sediminis]
MRGAHHRIQSDNGPEFVAKEIQRWLKLLEIETMYVEPGSPWQNGYAKSFHSRVRDEILAMEIFESLASAQRLTRQWKEDYNENRPHSSVGYVTPAEFAARWAAPVPATPTPLLQQPSELTQALTS